MRNNCCDNKYPYFDYRTLMDPRRAKQIQPVEGVVFNAVVIPASLGSSEEGQPYAPKNGLFKNAVVQYEADGATFIYTSDGVPVPIVNVVLSVNGHTGTVVLKTSDLENDADFQSGAQVAATVNTAVAEEAALRAAADGNLQTAITNEAGARASADTTLQNNIDAEALARGNADTTLQNNIGAEITARENADNTLQTQIDAIVAASDVKDIVGTYADLQQYDTSTLGDNDIIKVLQDENQNNQTTYYRWSTTTETFTLIGSEGPYYTKSAADQKFQEKLTAGANISIDANNEISATDTTYTAGTNISIDANNRISATDTTYTAGANVQISATNEISATDTTYTAGNGLSLSGTVFSADTTILATKEEAVGEDETYTIASTDWTALTGASPYTFSADVTATHTIGNGTLAELINDNAVEFATYGFAISAISGQTVTIYSIGQPAASETLTINYKEIA